MNRLIFITKIAYCHAMYTMDIDNNLAGYTPLKHLPSCIPFSSKLQKDHINSIRQHLCPSIKHRCTKIHYKEGEALNTGQTEPLNLTIKSISLTSTIVDTS